MKKSLYITIVLLCIIQISKAQSKIGVDSFDTVIVSPHIETTFIQGSEEAITIESCTVPENKLNFVVRNNTLRIYLDDAKEVTKTKTVVINGVKRKVPIYKGTVATLTITYKQINQLSLRGEENTLFKSPIITENFDLKIYGESQVIMNKVQCQDLAVHIYGESTLEIKEGITNYQKIVAYGEGEVNCSEVQNKRSLLRAYGEAEFQIKASERIKFTAYGEAKLFHSGNASVTKGITIGDVKISRVD